MSLFRRRQTSSPQRCFYCNQYSNQQPDTHEWLCPLCDAINHLDQNGEIADYTPPVTTQDGKPRLPLRPSYPPLNSPFCQSCANNHTVLVNSLASFIPDDSHPDYQTYLAAYPAYRAQLEELYPLVCGACAPQVKGRLDRNNYIAKARALGNWLEKSNISTGKNKMAWGTRFRIVLWFIKGALWCSTIFLLFVFYIYGIVYTPDQLRSHYPFFTIEKILALDSGCFIPLRSFLRRYLPLSFLYNFWLCAWYKAIRTPNATLSGTKEYHKIQWLQYIFRLVFIYSFDYPSSGVSLFFVLFSSLALVFSFYSLKVVTPPKITLQDSHPTSFDAIVDATLCIPPTLVLQKQDHTLQQNIRGDNNRSHPVHFSPRPTWIPLDIKTPAKSPSPFTASVPIPPAPRSSLTSSQPTRNNKLPPLRNPVLKNSGLSTGMSFTISEEPRFQSPLVDPTNKAHLPLAPQKFFAPEEATGLENLFAPALRLDDEPLIVQALKNVKRHRPCWIDISAFFFCTIVGIWKPFVGWAGLCIIASILGTGRRRFVQIFLAAVISVVIWCFQKIIFVYASASISLAVLCGMVSWRIWARDLQKQQQRRKKL
ncbi:Integral inner nuclear membrane protein ima1 [Neolecta irregularis DAH-3]|uniref:Integral inner nuclear membrane protein ima1 n=1 Tax=Neolecta irregularis (strain DAH-3) TaxID=1198029 RepID=A0A1U7LSQ9_NEOID|nr:Integral inner nuclear membrane protein ima1 [Neolecta irregularis DAH-3]|eukprot:OLL25697.1 Integral inner nuclear membrane protein ima1 [Neolecta irregularis DAH-3]